MNTLNCSFGTQAAQILPGTSRIFAMPGYILHSLHDLLDALGHEEAKDLAMLRTTASHLAEFFGAELSAIPLSSLCDCRASFRLYMESRKYKKNSVRSFSNYVGVLLKYAQNPG